MKRILMALILVVLSIANYGCGGGAGSSNSPGGENPGVPSIVQLLPSHFIAQTNSAVTLHAKVLDGNGSALRNVPVRFTKISALGDLYNERDSLLSNPVVKTNSNGIATIRLKSFVEGFATVQAEVNKGVGVVRDRRTVFFATNTNLQPFMTLDVDSDGDGVFNEPEDFRLLNPTNNQAIIRATVFNRFGQRAFGSLVTFGSDSTEVSFPTGNTAFTNQSGEASVLIQVDPAAIRNFVTVINIFAFADNGAANMVSLFLQPVTVSRVSISANPSVVAPNGTSSILATVFLNTGTRVPDGSTVSFIASCGTVTPFAQTLNSVATATFTAPSVPPPSGSCDVTASIGGVTSSPPAKIFVTTGLTVQPAEQTINGGVGGNAIYTIFGGVAPYTVTSSNPGIAFNRTAGNGIWTVASNGGTFTVTVPPGTPPDAVTLTVRDSVGATEEATLTIGAGTDLSVQPGAQTVAVGNDATFSIFGGAPPYNVFSSDVSLQADPATVSASGGTFAVHVPSITSATSVTYTVVDSAGTTATATLTITGGGGGGAASLVLVPGSASVIGAAGGTLTFTISGGTPAYVITSTDPANGFNTTAGNGVWNVPASGGTFTVTVPAGAPDGTVTLNAFDSTGNTESVALTITGGGTPASGGLAVTPASISLTGLSDATDSVTFTITGGTAPYSMFSTNTAVIPNVSVTGNTFTVNPFPVSTTTAVPLTVVDNVGATATATVTVTPASSSMSVNPSTIAVYGSVPILFNIIGGLPPYNVYSSDTTIVNLGGNPITLLAGTISFTANTTGTAGSATITIVDSDGKTVTAAVTVAAPPTPPPPSAISVAPPAATICEDSIACSAGADVALFTISGGTPPYTATSLTPGVIPSPGLLPGSFFVVDAANGSIAADTPVILTLTDTASGFASVTVTVINQP